MAKAYCTSWQAIVSGYQLICENSETFPLQTICNVRYVEYNQLMTSLKFDNQYYFEIKYQKYYCYIIVYTIEIVTHTFQKGKFLDMIYNYTMRL